MNGDQLQDLKQFINATVSQQLAGVKKEIVTDIESLKTEMNKGFADMAEILDTRVEPAEEQLANHEQRITRLESAEASS